MDGTLFDLIVFLTATFSAAVIAGLAGFAFGLVAAAVWLHILTPLQTAALIIAFGLIVQGFSVWKLRAALDWRKLWPFVTGASVGVPIGVAILGWTNPAYVRAGTGGFLVLYSLYALALPYLKPLAAGGRAADATVGFFNGILGGITGLAGILVTIWCGLRGWPKDQQRAVFQPVAVAIFLQSTLWLGATHAVTADILKLFVLDCRPCWRAPGSGSSSTASSTEPVSARLFSPCCSSRELHLSSVDQSRACTMASRTCWLLLSCSVTMGSLTVSAHFAQERECLFRRRRVGLDEGCGGATSVCLAA